MTPKIDISDEELAYVIFTFFENKYVQRADDRQKSMGLQYTNAETHDLSRETAKLFKNLLLSVVTVEV